MTGGAGVRIIHRVACWYDEPAERLREIGLDCPQTPVGIGRDMLVLDIDEADPRWLEIKAVLDACGIMTTVRTEFTPAKIHSAQWLAMEPDWHHGYPMPDSGFGYRDLTYDLTDYCAKCGIGTRQKAPFRMRREPKWGRKGLMQLNWVFDEFFALSAVWKTVFAPFGIGARPVLAYRKETELKTVVQLCIDPILDVELHMKDHPFNICEFCQRKKYLPFVRGMFPALTRPVEGVHAVRSQEWFGDGASAYRAILVSGELARRLLAMKVRGCLFAPLAQC